MQYSALNDINKFFLLSLTIISYEYTEKCNEVSSVSQKGPACTRYDSLLTIGDINYESKIKTDCIIF